MPRCLECEKNKTIEETKNKALESTVLRSFLCKSLYLGRRWENGICREK